MRGGAVAGVLLVCAACGTTARSSATRSLNARMTLGETSSYLDPVAPGDHPSVSSAVARRVAHVPSDGHGASSVRLARYTSTSAGPGYRAVLVWAFITTGLTQSGAGPSPVTVSGCTDVWLASAQSGADLGGTSWCP